MFIQKIKNLFSKKGHLSQISDSNIIGVVTCNREGRILSANQYFCDMVGISPEVIRFGKVKVTDFATDSSKVMKVVEKLVAGQKIPTFEKEYLHKSGRRVPALVTLYKIDRDTHIALINDLSERKQMESELAEVNSRLKSKVDQQNKELFRINSELREKIRRESEVSRNLKISEQFLSSIFETIPHMIFVKSAKDLRFVSFNKAGEKLIGIPKEELIGKNDYDFFKKEEADFFTQKDREVLESKKITDIPCEPINTVHGEKFLHTTKIPICNDKGEPEYLLGISEDISQKRSLQERHDELVKAEAETEVIKESVQRLNFISESSQLLSEALCVEKTIEKFCKHVVSEFSDFCFIDQYDAEEDRLKRIATSFRETSGKIHNSDNGFFIPLEVKDEACQLLVIKTKKDNRCPDVTPERVRELLGKPFENHAIRLASEIIVAPVIIGDEVWGLATFSSPKDKDSFSEMDLSTIRNLTKRLSLSLQNSHLYRQSIEANKAKSHFLSSVSHELRTPLGAIIGFSELALESEFLTSGIRDYINTIKRNGDLLLNLVNEILDLSKAESEHIELEMELFSLKRLIKDVSQSVSIKAAEKGLELKILMTPELPDQFIGDSLRVRQILLNILSNAIKFTNKGWVKLEVTSKVEEEGGQRHCQLSFLVSDTGFGIPSEEAKTLFRPFSQSKSSMKKGSGGTGLGLYLSRKLARLMNGDVFFIPDDNRKGSQFQIDIDLTMIAEKDSAISLKKDISILDGLNKKAKGERLLIVEDYQENQLLIEKFSKDLFKNVDLAPNGEEGLKKIFDREYDLVFMDIQMPVMGGFEAIKILRQRGYKGKVVALTADAMKGNREKCLEAGFDDFITKPINRRTIEKAVAQYLA